MKLGLGSGRTAETFVRLLGDRVRSGLDIVGVPTSERTARLAESEKIPADHPRPQPGSRPDGRRCRRDRARVWFWSRAAEAPCSGKRSSRRLRGGCWSLPTNSKLVEVIGAFPLPIEVVPFGLGATRGAIEETARGLGLTGPLSLRLEGARPFVTDGGHHILDASFGRIPDPARLAATLCPIPGVVEHGLFIGLASAAVIGRDERVEWLVP